MTVKQLTNTAIIDWRSFSIGQGQTTKFIQPSALSAALNRVTGGDPSAIYGTLQSNGKVYLINPNGITVGPTGVINTQSFIASTMDVSNSQFLSGGNLQFSGSSLAGISNAGTINALGGDILMIAHSVQNTGTVNALNGTAAMAAGSEVLYQPSANQPVFVQAGNDTAPIGVDQQGVIKAATAELAAAGGNVYGIAVNNAGVVNASAVSNVGGHIYLTAPGGSVVNSGTLKATNGNQGGDVTVVGDSIDLKPTSTIDASGANGGGTALIGGDEHGANPNVPDATTTTVEAGATINADATDNGNGGKVVVWSNDDTTFAGTISARGGPNGGNGGFVETSGGVLAFLGSVDTLAPKGVIGTLLLDPENVVIENNGGVCQDPTCPGDTYGPLSPIPGGAGPSSIVDTGALDKLLTSSSVTIETDSVTSIADPGNITVLSQILWPSTSHTSLSLIALGGSITIDAPIIGGGGVSMTSGGSSAPITLNANITTSSGDQQYGTAVVIPSGANIDLSANGGGRIVFSDTVSGAGSLSLSASFTGVGAAIQFQSPIEPSLGSLSIVTSGNGLVEFSGPGVQTSGSQFYSAPVQVDTVGNFSATGVGSVIAFSKTLDTTGMPLTISAPGSVSLGAVGTAGSGTSVTDLTVTSAGGINLNGGTYTIGESGVPGSLSLNGPVQLGADTTITMNDGSIFFSSTINGNGHSLTTNSEGLFNTTFSGNVSNLSSLDATGNLINVGSVSGSGNITFESPVELSGDSTFSAGGAIDFKQFLDQFGSHFNLTTVSGAGTTFAALGTFNSLTATDTSANGINLPVGTYSTNGGQTYSGIVNCIGGGCTFNAASLSLNGGYTGLSLDATAPSINLSGTLTTTGPMTFHDPVALTGNATLSASSIDFASTVDGSSNLTAQTSFGTTFSQAVGSGTPLSSLSVTGPATIDGTVHTSGGSQTYVGSVTLGGSEAFFAGAGAITFESTLNGASPGDALTLNSGSAFFDAPVGGSTPLASLTVNGAAGIGSNITTSGGGQSYTGSAVITGNATLIDNNHGEIAFGSSVNGTGVQNLTVDGETVSFGGPVAGLSTLSVVGPSGISLAGDVTTTNSQSYTGPVSLSANVSQFLTATGPTSSITFGGTLDAAATPNFDIVILGAGSGGVDFGGAVGSIQPLYALQVDSTGSITLAGGSVLTQSAQAYNGPVVLASSLTSLTSIGGSVIFNSTVDSDSASNVRVLDVNAISGGVTFAGAVGSSQALTGLAVTGGSAMLGGNVTTSGAQNYLSPVQLTSDATLTTTGSGGIDFASTVDGAFNLTINDAGATTISGAVGTTPLASLTITSAGGTTLGNNVTTDGDQTYNSPLLAAGSLQSNSGSITFNNTLDGTSVGDLLSITAGGNIAFNGAIGSINSINSLTASAAGTITIAPGATLTATGSLTDPILPVSGSYLAAAGNITILSPISSPGLNLLLYGGDQVTFLNTASLASLQVFGPTSLDAFQLQTTGAQTYNGPVLIGGSRLLQAGGDITFNSTIDGNSPGIGALTVESSGNVTFNGAIGGVAPLFFVTSAAGGTITAPSVGILATGGWTDPFMPAAPSGPTNTVLIGAGNITFNNFPTVLDGSSGLKDLTLYASGGGLGLGTVEFDYPIGNVSPLNSLTVFGTTNLNSGFVSTTSKQQYNGPVVLNASSTLLGGTGSIGFSSTLDGGQALTIEASSIELGGNVGATAPLANLIVQGATRIDGGLIQTLSDPLSLQAFEGPVEIGASATTFSAPTGRVIFDSTLDAVNTSMHSVEFDTGSTEFDAAVGAFNPFYQMTVNSAATVNGLFVMTNGGGQFYKDAVTLGAGIQTFVDLNAGNITFNSTLDGEAFGPFAGPSTARFATSGSVQFNGEVGGITALNSLLFDVSPTPTQILVWTDLINTSGGGQTYNGPVRVTVPNVTFSDAAGGAITFGTSPTSPALDGASAVAIETSGNTNLIGMIGSTTALSSLHVTGLTSIASSVIDTTGAQNYDRSVLIHNGLALTPLTVALSGGSVIFGSTLDDGGIGDSLSITGAGGITFDDAVGFSRPFTNLTLASTQAGSLFTFEDRGNGSLYLGGTTRLTSNFGTAIFNGTVNDPVGGSSLTFDNTSVIFNAPVGGTAPLGSLSVINGGATEILGGLVATNAGGQSYSGPVVLDNAAGSTTLKDIGGGAIAFGNFVDGAFGLPAPPAQALTIQTDGVISFASPVGSSTPLYSLTLQGFSTASAGSTSLNGGTIATSGGGQSYHNPVTLGADALLSNSGGGAITFSSTVDGPASLSAAASGGIFFNAPVGSNSALNALTVTGPTHLEMNAAPGNSILTAGDQTYNGALTLGFDTTLVSAGNITFNGSIDGASSGNQSLNAFASLRNGNVAFNGPVGTINPLANLFATGAGILLNGGVVTVTDFQEYNAPVILGANVILTGGDNLLGTCTAPSCGVQFDSTVDGRFSLSATGVPTFIGPVGQTTPLASLTTNGFAFFDGGLVSTIGAQTYNGGAFGGSDLVFQSVSGSMSFPQGAVTIPGNLTIDAGTGNVSWGLQLLGDNVFVKGDMITMNGNIITTGTTGATMVASGSFNDNHRHIFLTGGGRYLIYSVSPLFDNFGPLTGETESGVSYPTLPSFMGNGFLFSQLPAPVDFSTLQQQQSFFANGFPTPLGSPFWHGGDILPASTPCDPDSILCD